MAFRTSQLLTNFAEKSADGMLTTDVNGIITWANPAAGKLLGWSVHQLVSQHISVFCAPEVIYRYASLQGRVLSGEAVFDAAATVLRRDGTLVDVSLAWELVRDADANPNGMSCVIRELSRERDGEREAARASFSQAATPQMMLGVDGTFLATNEAFCGLIGHSGADMRHRSVRDYVHDLDSRAGAAAMEAIIAGRESAAIVEVLIRHADGHPVPALVDITVLRDDAGTP